MSDARRITDYEVITLTDPSLSPSDLKWKVKDAIARGWEPIGGIAIATMRYDDGSGVGLVWSQAIVKRED